VSFGRSLSLLWSLSNSNSEQKRQAGVKRETEKIHFGSLLLDLFHFDSENSVGDRREKRQSNTMMMLALRSPLLGLFVFLLNLLVFTTQGCPNPDQRPDWRDKAATARWMVHSMDYGVLSTLSTRFAGQSSSMPFGNIYSFVDGSCDNSTGTPYFYGTYMDQSFQDMQSNPVASFALTEASLTSSTSKDVRQACSIEYSTDAAAATGDPENPVCARITLTGTLVEVDRTTNNNEFTTIQAAFFERHPQMKNWPEDHEWVIAKLVIQNVWLIDYYGGASVLDPATYYGHQSDAVREAIVDVN